MTSSKKAFGQFVTAKRKAAGLTQAGLAERLFVTESAVSKWERGVSYPDISLVAPLAEHLGVTEGELIRASDDVVAARVDREARFYRRWRAGILWTTAVAYAVALAACFVVNLAVDGTVDWFWVVLASVAMAFSLTTLPLLLTTRRTVTVLAAFLAGLVATLAVSWAYSGGGEWLPIALGAVLLAAVVVLGPVALRYLELPSPWSRQRVVMALAADTLALAAFLLVVTLATGRTDEWWTRIVPIAALALVWPWVVALVLRYLPGPRLARAAVVVAFTGAYVWVLPALIARILDEPRSPVDLGRWRDPYVNGNVSLVVLVVCLVIAAVLAVAAAVSASQEDRTSLGARRSRGLPG